MPIDSVYSAIPRTRRAVRLIIPLLAANRTCRRIRARVDRTLGCGSGRRTLCIRASSTPRCSFVLLAVGGDAGHAVPQSLYLPLGADRIIIDPGLHRSLVARAHVRKAAEAATLVADIWVDTLAGASAMIIEGMRFAVAESVARVQAQDCGKSLPRQLDANFQYGRETTHDATGTWLIFADKGGSSDRPRGKTSEVRGAGRPCDGRKPVPPDIGG